MWLASLPREGPLGLHLNGLIRVCLYQPENQTHVKEQGGWTLLVEGKEMPAHQI